MFVALICLGIQDATVKDNWVEYNRARPVAPRTRFSSRLPLSDQADANHWQLDPTVSDEFDGGFDASKWSKGMHDWIGHEPGWFSDDDARVANGNLQIVMKQDTAPAKLDPKIYHGYSSGAVQSRKKNLYGYFEIRAKPMKSHGSSAFFFTDNLGQWWTEIDVFEIGGTAPQWEDIDQMGVHVFRTPAEEKHWTLNSKYRHTSQLADDYHVYGLDWEPNTIQFYFDGVLVYQGKNTHWHQPLYLSLDSELMEGWYGMPTPGELPSTFSVDYVRAWKRSS